ncbi:hypothetical protein N657DRAFT_428566 [Parathielavia appendiculata]|uniref:Uncharacterized protein n=1 Tax=Parathielavia appendiculata TaxID=2587402 RepID=A0AAN6Z3N2_9PEZI|nr:hypothetical protein N657DRAFT_428566 [Parathielavia appendiculata]
MELSPREEGGRKAPKAVSRRSACHSVGLASPLFASTFFNPCEFLGGGESYGGVLLRSVYILFLLLTLLPSWGFFSLLFLLIYFFWSIWAEHLIPDWILPHFGGSEVCFCLFCLSAPIT